MATQKGSKTSPAAGTSAAPSTQPTALQVAAAQRRETRRLALEAAQAVIASPDGQVTPLEALQTMVSAFTPTSRASAGPRVILDKAEPTDVKAFFDGTGLTRKELAAAAGVSTSVIATVQNPKGDRWSTKTFAEKQAAIATWITEHQAEIDARRANEAAEEAARKAAADAKAQRALARQQAATAKAAAKAAPKAAKTASAPKAKAAPAKPAAKPKAQPAAQVAVQA